MKIEEGHIRICSSHRGELDSLTRRMESSLASAIAEIDKAKESAGRGYKWTLENTLPAKWSEADNVINVILGVRHGITNCYEHFQQIKGVLSLYCKKEHVL